ncbi:MAG: paraquat-inducible protein A [Crocinitomicaceae bacterium]
MKNFWVISISVAVLFAATFVFTISISQKLNNYKSKKEEVVALLQSDARLGNVWEWIPIFSPADRIMEEKRALEKKANLYYNSAVRDGLILFAVVVVFLLVNSWFYRKKEYSHQMIGLALVSSSLCFLYLGLQSPFLEIEAFKDDFTVSAELADYGLSDTIKGRIYFFYQNHNVMELIKLLYTGGNFFVAILLLTFSVVFPTIKLISSVVVFLSPASGFAKNAVTTINKLGKWSMADVFVASIFLAYFSFSNSNLGIDTGSTTLIGLHFFVAFVIFSIFSGIYLKKTVIAQH